VPTIALFSWPVLSALFLGSQPARWAVMCCILVGYLLLPESFNINLPGMPPIHKQLMVALSVGLVWVLTAKGAKAQATAPTTNASPWIGIVLYGLIAVWLGGSVMTVLTNGFPLFFGPRVLQATRVYDLIGTTLNTVILLTPFIVGRHLFRTKADHHLLLRCLVIAGLLYSILIMMEVRLSPILHNWVYGFHQHSFAQHVRGGAYRPKVFLQHGIWVGIFLFMVIMAAGALYRSTKEPKWLLAMGWLMIVLVLSRNLGALMITVMFVPLLWLNLRMQVMISVVVSTLFLLYPVVRQSNVVPLESIISFAQSVSPQRAASFKFRLDNEDILLERALRKPLFGWGGWGRSRVFDERGRDISVTDGLWVIHLGVFGWVGYITFFGVLLMPVFLLMRRQKRSALSPETTAMALIMSGILFYLIPNAALNPIAWLMAGALAGFAQYNAIGGPNAVVASARPNQRSQTNYTRFPKQDTEGGRPPSARQAASQTRGNTAGAKVTRDPKAPRSRS